MSTWPFINPDAILESEDAGRAELIAGSYKVGFIALPADVRGEEQFEAVGFEFGAIVEGDLGVNGKPLWRLTRLPEGWRLEPEQGPYAFWTLIRDGAGD